MPPLSAMQHNILLWLNDQGDRVLYGPMSDPTVTRPRGYGFAGGSLFGSIRMATGDKLCTMGLIKHVKDKYPLGYYAITDAGRDAIAKAEGR